jgi:hypothetical protein
MSSRAGASAEQHPDSGGGGSHRASLFGSSFGVGASAQARQGGASAASSMQQALEEDNNRLTDDLSQKVSALRYASQSIHDEVSEQNRLLSGMVRGWGSGEGTQGQRPELSVRFNVLRARLAHAVYTPHTHTRASHLSAGPGL